MAAKNKVQQLEIKGMEEMHWKVSFERHPLDQFKERINEANVMELLYEPYELYTDVRKRNQIELIKAAVFELKRDFNKEFIAL